VSTLIGLIVMFGAVLGGFAMGGGPFPVLLQPAELVVIGGATVGTVIISAPGKVMSRVLASLKKAFQNHTPSKADYLDLLKLLYQILALIRREGVLALEPHVSESRHEHAVRRVPEHHQAPPRDGLLGRRFEAAGRRLLGGRAEHVVRRGARQPTTPKTRSRSA